MAGKLGPEFLDGPRHRQSWVHGICLNWAGREGPANKMTAIWRPSFVFLLTSGRNRKRGHAWFLGQWPLGRFLCQAGRVFQRQGLFARASAGLGAGPAGIRFSEDLGGQAEPFRKKTLFVRPFQSCPSKNRYLVWYVHAGFRHGHRAVAWEERTEGLEWWGGGRV